MKINTWVRLIKGHKLIADFEKDLINCAIKMVKLEK